VLTNFCGNDCWCCDPTKHPTTIFATTNFTGGTFGIRDNCPPDFPTSSNLCSTLNGVTYQMDRVTPFKPCYKFLACSCSNNSNLSMGGRIVGMYKPADANLLAYSCGGGATQYLTGNVLLGPYKFLYPSPIGDCAFNDCVDLYGVLDVRLYLMTRGGSNGTSTSGNGCDSGTLTYPSDHKCFWAFVHRIKWYTRKCVDTACIIDGIPPWTCFNQVNYWPAFTDKDCCASLITTPQISFRQDDPSGVACNTVLPNGTADVSWASSTGSGVSCLTAFTVGTCSLDVTLSSLTCPSPEEEGGEP